MNTKIASPLATIAALLLSMPATAYVVTTSIGTYDVTITAATSFNALSAVLPSEPWFGSRSLAVEFTNAVAGNLGFFNQSGDQMGPVFAYTANGNTGADSFFGSAFRSGSAFTFNAGKSQIFTFAVATEVQTPLSEPGTLGLVIVGLAGTMWARRRKAA
jgi:hypothetical protein